MSSRPLATAAASATPNPALAHALRLSPYYDHLDATNLPQGYAPFQGPAGKRYAVLDTPLEKSQNDNRVYRSDTSGSNQLVLADCFFW